jgi:hypothetical protein
MRRAGLGRDGEERPRQPVSETWEKVMKKSLRPLVFHLKAIADEFASGHDSILKRAE